MRLSDKVAVVTGATGGIGGAIVAAFAREGARLVCSGTRSTWAGLPTAARYLAGDVRDEAYARRLIGESIDTFGRLDILVNAHGVEFDSDLTQTSLEDAARVIDINLLGAFATMKHAIPAMLSAGGGSIVNIGSRLGLVAIPLQAVYSASKGGLIMLSRGAAIDYALQNIRVNVVAPGLTATERFAARANSKPDPDAYRRQREATIPIGRLVTPEEVAGAVVYLASDEASGVTGAVLLVDGGYTAA